MRYEPLVTKMALLLKLNSHVALVQEDSQHCFVSYQKSICTQCVENNFGVGVTKVLRVWAVKELDI